MRILVLTQTFLPAWGGAERLLYEVFRRIAGRHEVRMISPHPPEQAVNAQAQSLLEALPFPVNQYHARYRGDRTRGRRLHQGFFPPFDFSAIPAVARETQTFRPNVLSVFYAIPTGLAGLLASRRHDVPMVLSLVGRDVPGPTTLPGWKYYDRLLIRAAAETTYISDYCRVAVFGENARPGGVRIGAGAQAHPAASDGHVQQIRERMKIAGETTVLFALQRLSVYKGVDVLIRSMSHLKDRDCVLVIAGGGKDRERLEALASELGLEGRVHILGFTSEEDLNAWWQLAHIFVFHSYYETFGLVAAEAMSAGKPVVSVNSTAIPEVVEHGRTGLLVPPGNPVAFAGAVRQLIDDPALRDTLADAGREKATREFSWDTIANQYETVFEHAARQTE